MGTLHKFFIANVILLNITISACLEETSNRFFPQKFKFGASTSAYQIEGAWNEDGKGENIMDSILHIYPNIIKDRSNGDIACDSYHKLDDDMAMIKELGLDYYRFSISWNRIFKDGRNNKINAAGVAYYKKLIDALIKANVEPMVTLFHWDLPKAFLPIGGWSNGLLIQYFTEYATFAFETFGYGVKKWITFNEPNEICGNIYDQFTLPGINDSVDVVHYECGRTILLAHANVYHLYQKKYKQIQNGKISMSISFQWGEPASNSTLDIQAAKRYVEFTLGWFAHPIYLGNYPQTMIDRVANKSALQGYTASRLRPLSLDEQSFINGTSDFFALNTYSASLIKWNEDDNSKNASYSNDLNVILGSSDSWQRGATSWFRVVPWGFRKTLNLIQNSYQCSEIIVTENGYPDEGQIGDVERIEYYKAYLTEALNAIYLDNVKLKGYITWSLMDNFEWDNGYTAKFGLYSVDFNDPNRTRTPKSSVAFYKNLIKTKCLDNNCD